jgi:hypothetical protein
LFHAEPTQENWNASDEEQRHRHLFEGFLRECEEQERS